MHKILLSQQLQAEEELVWEGVGEEARGIYSIWAAGSCVHVRLRGSFGCGSGSHCRLKCNEVLLKGAPVTGKQGKESKKCAVIKGEEEKCPCLRVAFGV